MEAVYTTEADEELLTKKDLAERILKCDVKSAERHFIYQPGFPYIMIGSSRRYPKKLVEKWLHENAKYA